MRKMVYLLALVIASFIGGVLGGTMIYGFWAFALAFATVEWQMTTVMALVIYLTTILGGAGGGWIAGHYVTQFFWERDWL